MATPSHLLIQDQNLNILQNGGKIDVIKADKKGRISGRKALNDISNSRKPSIFQSNKTENLKNAVSTGKDLCAASNATAQKGKASEKGKDVSRKALGDITNSVKRPLQQYEPKASGKLSTVAEEEVPNPIVDEGFLHNHQECIKAQTKIMDLNFFVKSVGLDNDIPVNQSAVVKSSPKKSEELVEEMNMEEMSEQHSDDQFLNLWKTEISGNCSPSCRSPESPKLPYMSWGEEIFSGLMINETPKRMHPYP